MWTERVKQALATELDMRTVSAGVLADHFDISVRGLSRKLHAEGVSISKLVDEERMRRAHAALVAPGTSLDWLSYELGFSEVSSFCRAFKRWTGSSPRRYGAALELTKTTLREPPSAPLHSFMSATQPLSSEV